MSLLSRVKRLWELSEEPYLTVGDLVPPLVLDEVTDEEIDQAVARVTDPGKTVMPTRAQKRMATVLQDDPLDVFPSEDPEHEGELE